MSRLKSFFRKNREALNTRTARVGGYSFLMALVVLAILIAVNVAVSSLPSTWTHYDISAAQLYSVTSSTKAVVQNLDEDVDIFWIVQDGQEDTVIEKLLDVYDSLNDSLYVTKVNPDVYPTFAAQYTDETVSNNSLIVASEERSRYIGYDEIYLSDYDYTYYSVSTSFDGEGAITTAISYVTSDELPVLYMLTGHGESELSEAFEEGLKKQNIETEEFSLLTVDEIPEEAAAVLINAPSSDISGDEADMLLDYMDGGGRLLVISGPQEDGELTNLHSILENYGITAEEGIVIESDRSYTAFGYPYVLLPILGDSDITTELSENNSYVVVPIAQGLSVGSTPSNVTVTELLTTTEESFSKVAGYSLDTYDEEEGDIDGPFALAVSVEDTESGAELLWIGSDDIMDDGYVSYSAGANSDFVMNSLVSLIGDTDAITINSKSLSYSYLTINSTQAVIIEVCIVALIPLLYLGYGLEDTLRRRKKA